MIRLAVLAFLVVALAGLSAGPGGTRGFAFQQPASSSTALAGDAAALPGDVNCDGAVNAVDALTLLRHVAALSVNQVQPCTAIGTETDGLAFGDANCDGAVNAVDALAVLRHVAGIAPLQDCGAPGLVPDEIDGVTLLIETSSGQDFVAVEDQGWDDTFAAMGISAADVNLTTGTAPTDSDLDFQMGAFEIVGFDWESKLAVFIADIEARSGGLITFDEINLGGKDATRGTKTDEPTVAPIYYYVLGDALIFIQSPDEAPVAEALGGLPATSQSALSGPPVARPAGALPQEFEIGILPVRVPNPAACVGYVEEISVRFFITNLTLRILMPHPWFHAFSSTFGGGQTEPDEWSGNFLYSFNYTANTLPATQPGNETITVFVSETSDPGSDIVGTTKLPFPVELCLSGQWQDGPRILAITHEGDSVTAEIVSGTLVCGEGGTAFSATLNGNTLTGGDLKVCNPDECVDAGILPKTAVESFEGLVTDDAKVAAIIRQKQFFDFEYDDDNNLIACTPSDVSPAGFSIDRTTFGPPKPF